MLSQVRMSAVKKKCLRQRPSLYILKKYSVWSQSYKSSNFSRLVWLIFFNPRVTHLWRTKSNVQLLNFASFTLLRNYNCNQPADIFFLAADICILLTCRQTFQKLKENCRKLLADSPTLQTFHSTWKGHNASGW